MRTAYLLTLLAIISVVACRWNTEYWRIEPGKGWKTVSVPKNTFGAFGLQVPSTKVVYVTIEAISADVHVSDMNIMVPFDSVDDIAKTSDVIPKGTKKMVHFSPKTLMYSELSTTGYIVCHGADGAPVKFKYQAGYVPVATASFSATGHKTVAVTTGDGESTSDWGYFAFTIDQVAGKGRARYMTVTLPNRPELLFNTYITDADGTLDHAYTIGTAVYTQTLHHDTTVVFGVIKENPNAQIALDVQITFVDEARIADLPMRTAATATLDATHKEQWYRITIPAGTKLEDRFTSFGSIQLWRLALPNSIDYTLHKCVRDPQGRCTDSLPDPAWNYITLTKTDTTIDLDGTETNRQPLESGVYWLHLRNRDLGHTSVTVYLPMDVCPQGKGGHDCGLTVATLPVPTAAQTYPATVGPDASEPIAIYRLAFDPTRLPTIKVTIGIVGNPYPSPMHHTDFVFSHIPFNTPDPLRSFDDAFISIQLDGLYNQSRTVTIEPHKMAYGHDGELYVTVFTTMSVNFHIEADYVLNCHGNGHPVNGRCVCEGAYDPAYDCSLVKRNHHELETNGTVSITVKPQDTYLSELAAHTGGKPVNMMVTRSWPASRMTHSVELERVDRQDLSFNTVYTEFTDSPDDAVRLLIPYPQSVSTATPENIHYNLFLYNGDISRDVTFTIQPVIGTDHSHIPTRGFLGMVVHFFTLVVLPLTGLLVFLSILVSFIAFGGILVALYFTGAYKPILEKIKESAVGHDAYAALDGDTADADNEMASIPIGSDEYETLI